MHHTSPRRLRLAGASKIAAVGQKVSEESGLRRATYISAVIMALATVLGAIISGLLSRK
jgi:hypothetical protein